MSDLTPLPLVLAALGMAPRLGESVADVQRAAFNRNPVNRGHASVVGLWRYLACPKRWCFRSGGEWRVSHPLFPPAVNRWLITLAPFWLPVAAMAVDPDALVRHALAAEARLDSQTALRLFQQADAARPDDAFILQKIARQYSDLVVDQPDDAARRRFAQAALEYAQRAVALKPEDPVNVLSLAVCYGKLAVYSDTQAKIRYSRFVKAEAERALELDPGYAWAHHVLGRWHYEVAALGSTSRFFVRLFYGGLPPASFADGIRHLRRASELDPGELNHWLELGFAQAAAGLSADAAASWRHGLAMPSRGKHDAAAKERASAALRELPRG